MFKYGWSSLVFPAVSLCLVSVSCLELKKDNSGTTASSPVVVEEPLRQEIKRPWKPLPCGKDVFTQEKYLALKRDWFTRLQGEAFDQHGVRSPAWDTKVHELLQRWAAYFCSTHAGNASSRGELEGLVRLSSEIQAAGCGDPWAAYLHGWLLHLSGKPDVGKPFMVKAEKALETSSYPRIFPYLVQKNLAQQADTSLPRRDREYQAYLKPKWKNLALAAGEPAFAGKNSRFFGEYFRTDWLVDGDSSVSLSCLEIFLATRKKMAGIPEWIQLFVQGRHEFELALVAQRWNTSEPIKPAAVEHTRKAIECFERAYSLCPECPEIALAMFETLHHELFVVAGFNPHEWFDRAVAARFDCMPAYVAYSKTLMDGGGMNGSLYQFAMDCMDTNRYDTQVPWMYTQCCRILCFEGGNDPQKFYRNPELYARMCIFFRKAVAAPGMPEWDRDYNRTHFAVIQWLSGHPEEALKSLDALGDKRGEPCVFLDYGLSYRRVIGNCRLTLGRHKDEFEKVKELLKDKREQEAYPLLKALLTAVEPDPAASFVVREYLYPLEQQAAFAAGDWVNMMPGEEMMGWTGQGWRMDPDGTMVGVTGQYSFSVLCNTQFRDNFEYKGEVAMPEPGSVVLALGDRGYWRGVQDGGIFLLKNPPSNIQLMGMATDAKSLYGSWSWKGKLGNRFTFHAQLWGCRVWLYLNGTLVLAGEPICPESEKFYPGLRGIGGMANFPGFTMKCRNFQIRRLTSEPVPTEKPQGVPSDSKDIKKKP